MSEWGAAATRFKAVPTNRLGETTFRLHQRLSHPLMQVVLTFAISPQTFVLNDAIAVIIHENSAL